MTKDMATIKALINEVAHIETRYGEILKDYERKKRRLRSYFDENDAKNGLTITAVDYKLTLNLDTPRMVLNQELVKEILGEAQFEKCKKPTPIIKMVFVPIKKKKKT